jgi:hypothetical protein
MNALKTIVLAIAALGLSGISCARADDSQQAVAPFRELVRLQASDAAPGDNFGYHLSLSADGQTLAVGAYARDCPTGENAGSVYVFARFSGSWIEQARLQGDDTVEESEFGLAVGISADGDTLVAGAPAANNSGGYTAGSAYVFVRSDGKWTQQARLQASDAAQGARFGNVAISRDGNTVAVGAPRADTPGQSTVGLTYIFVRSGNSWSQQARLEANDAQSVSNFGVSVALSATGDTLAISASNATNSAGPAAGNVYIFVRSGTSWSQQVRLQASDAAAGDAFGTRVGLSADGNTLGTGAYHARGSIGNAYVFFRSGTTWTEQARLRASDEAAGDSFGTSPSLSADGNTFVIGTHLKDISGAIDAGSAYVFVRSNGIWKEQARLHASDAEAYDYFGLRVDISGDGNTLAVSAFGDNNSGGVDAGSAYIFTRGSTK